MTTLAHYTLPALTRARSAALRALSGAQRIFLLMWMALWYTLGWAIGIVVRVWVLGIVAGAQGFVDATGWTGILGWAVGADHE